jgi:quercetin dioxygenase-like cupin family protein
VKIHRHEGAEFNERASGPLFTGDVRRCRITSEADAESLMLGVSRFAPGARTVWHTHAFEQGLVVVDGRGLVGTRDEQHEVHPGDVVFIPAGEWHFHGATEESAMSHVSISGIGETVSGEPVIPLGARTGESTPG